MSRFFVREIKPVDGRIEITGSDCRHIRNVLRLKPGEDIIVCDGDGRGLLCSDRRDSWQGFGKTAGQHDKLYRAPLECNALSRYPQG